MGKHLGKRERLAGKRKKIRNRWFGWSNINGSGSLTLKLGNRKWNKINLQKISNAPF